MIVIMFQIWINLKPACLKGVFTCKYFIIGSVLLFLWRSGSRQNVIVLRPTKKSLSKEVLIDVFPAFIRHSLPIFAQCYLQDPVYMLPRYRIRQVVVEQVCSIEP